MPQLDIEDEIGLDHKQIAIITGKDIQVLKAEFDELDDKGKPKKVIFNWGPGRFHLKGIDSSNCVIKRLAAGQEELSPRGDDPAVYRPKPFHPRDVQENPKAWPGADVDSLPEPAPTLGPLDLKVAKPGTSPAGGTMDPEEVFGPQPDKQEHPPLFRTIGPIESLASNRAILMRMVGFKEPKIDPRLVREAARRLARSS